jgi:hypothetical protein
VEDVRSNVACVERVPKAKWSSKRWNSFIHHLTQNEILINTKKKVKLEQQQEFPSLRSSLALANETVFIRMVSSKIYWVDETILKLCGGGEESAKVYIGLGVTSLV